MLTLGKENSKEWLALFKGSPHDGRENELDSEESIFKLGFIKSPQ
jgi:hypothetical protein